jgi:hypothetical protein
MADEEKIDLAFNTDPFENAMNTIVKGIVRMTSAMEKGNQEVVKKDKVKNESMKKGFSNVVAFGIAKFEILKQAFRRVISEIPEFATTFKMAGDIILKQLLWPLRTQLIPMLQKMLNWVRDNRAVFLQLGVVIKNAFRVAIGIVKNFFGVLQSLFEGFNRTLGGMLNFENITEALNVAMFKIALLFAFLEVKIRPFATLLGEIFGQIIISVKNFAKGFADTFMSVAESMGIWEDLKTILEGIRDLLEFLSPAFEVLGNIIGTGLAASLKLAILPLKILMSFLSGIKDMVEGKINFTEFLDSLKDVTFESLKDVGKGILEGAGQTVETGKKVYNKMTGKGEKVDDAIIKPDGTIIRTNPLDTIMAVKNPEKSMSGSRQLSIGDMNINLNVTEGNAREAGINFANGLGQQIRSIFLDEALATGGIG